MVEITRSRNIGGRCDAYVCGEMVGFLVLVAYRYFLMAWDMRGYGMNMGMDGTT